MEIGVDSSMCAATDRQAKLQLVRIINESKKKIVNEISVQFGSLRKTTAAKSSYTYTDLQQALKDAEKAAKSITDQNLLTVSKEGVRLFSAAPGAVV